jgi:flagellar hook assembly protein FlgD
LERIHPDLESGDPDNWVAHVTMAGGSPGVQNSVFVERLPTQASLDASPNPFDERTILSYRLSLTTAYAHLWIYNSYGQLVRKLLDADPTGSERALVWDGRDDDGARLPMGIYIVYLEALNARKGVLCREKKAVVLAK